MATIKETIIEACVQTAETIKTWVRDSLSQALPEVTTSNDGDFLGVVNGEWGVVNAPNTGNDYSETFTVTNDLWIDGTPIKRYIKTGLASSGDARSYNPMGTTSVYTQLNATTIIDIRGAVYSGDAYDGSVFTLNNSHTSTGYMCGTYINSDGTLILRAGASVDFKSGYLVIDYV